MAQDHAIRLQIDCIHSFHEELCKDGEVTLEEAARRWVREFAKDWRIDYDARRATRPVAPDAGDGGPART